MAHAIYDDYEKINQHVIILNKNHDYLKYVGCFYYNVEGLYSDIANTGISVEMWIKTDANLKNINDKLR